MDEETKKAAEYCQIAGVGHVVASKPPLKPLVRHRTSERLPKAGSVVITSLGDIGWLEVYEVDGQDHSEWCLARCGLIGDQRPSWWAYLPEGDE